MVAFGPGTVLFSSYNRISGNEALGFGSGVFVDDGAQALFYGDLIHGNKCASDGSAIYIDGVPQGLGAIVDLVNVTVVDHEECGAGMGGQGLFVEGGSSVTVTNSIFYNNGAGDFFFCDADAIGGGLCFGGGSGEDEASILGVTYTLNDDDFPGDGNIVADPMFVIPQGFDSQDYRLQNGSPAIDAGNPADDVGLEPSPNGGIRNMGSYGGTAEATNSLK